MFRDVCWAPFCSHEGGGLAYVCNMCSMPRGNAGLSKHRDPVFPYFCPLNQKLARVRSSVGGGGGTACALNCHVVRIVVSSERAANGHVAQRRGAGSGAGTHQQPMTPPPPALVYMPPMVRILVNFDAPRPCYGGFGCLTGHSRAENFGTENDFFSSKSKKANSLMQ